ncbi:NhaP-type Na+/H+ or K+/H+ antiporter [Kitasatospora sp. MAP12-15]|uniref:cation:proton antiporter n=1 Tax=unclassified Kitasatospora TaxID=2633591 RepID=UPI0024737C9E|nr:cation:proton antiporter [Kitasatospora sp. MAP12-44]MDH6108128.1 NhaP-type Na+/H+ or K+/H+ antiporter [Kitasatospora sp. MAP12-44]
MIALLVSMGTLFVWAVVAGRLTRWSITAPVAMTAAGVALTVGPHPLVRISLTTSDAEHAVEIILAVLLFVDATEVPAGVVRRQRGLLARLLVIALPLTLAAGVLTGRLLFPDVDWWLAALFAAVTVPVDLAPADQLIRDARLPSWLRGVLTVEGGVNDGVVAPVFLLCLAGAEAHGGVPEPASDSLGEALGMLMWAVIAGVLVGKPGGWLLRRAWRSGWTRPAAARLGILALPLMAYALALELDGNGFVAAFVAGLCFTPYSRALPPKTLHLVEDTGALLALALWFVFGQLVTQAFTGDFDGRVVAYAALSLTVVRILPVLLSLTGSGLAPADRLLLAWLGPRGPASIVFGLLAFIALAPLEPHAADLVGQVMTMTVLMSLVLHGLTYGPLAARYAAASERAGRGPGSDPPADPPADQPPDQPPDRPSPPAASAVAVAGPSARRATA